MSDGEISLLSGDATGGSRLFCHRVARAVMRRVASRPIASVFCARRASVARREENRRSNRGNFRRRSLIRFCRFLAHEIGRELWGCKSPRRFTDDGNSVGYSGQFPIRIFSVRFFFAREKRANYSNSKRHTTEDSSCESYLISQHQEKISFLQEKSFQLGHCFA